MVNLLKELDIRSIITAHETDLSYLFEFYWASQKASLQHRAERTQTKLSWANGLPLNDTHSDCSVNLLCVEEESTTKKKQKTLFKKFTWITDVKITQETAFTIQQGGRTRWHIENDTFNTLKNQGYQFEHNFGHGKQNLSVVLAYLMFTASLIDQIQEFTCKHFNAALKKTGRLKYLWEKMRAYFFLYHIKSCEELYTAIAGNLGANLSDLVHIDTS